MKKGTLLALLASLLLPSLNGAVRGEESLKRYRLESGIVELSLTGAQVGTETLYFENWGMKEARHTKAELTTGGVTRKIDRLTLLDGEWMYNIDLIARTGKKMSGSIMTEVLERSEAKDLADLAEESMKEMGGVKTGTEEIAGKTCDVWVIEKMHTTNWMWNGLSLKMKINMAGVETQSIAVRVEENPKIPPEKLSIPDGIEIIDVSNR